MISKITEFATPLFCTYLGYKVPEFIVVSFFILYLKSFTWFYFDNNFDVYVSHKLNDVEEL